MEIKTSKTGRLRSWNERGYGIIHTNVRTERYFLHANSIVEGPEVPAPGSIVHFNIAPAYKGGALPQAVDAIVEEPKPVTSSVEVAQ